MAGVPHRLQIGTSFDQSIPLINDDFDKVIQDIRDLGANLSTVGLLNLTVPATSLVTSVFTLTSKGVVSTSANQVFTQVPAARVSGIAPQVDIYVDVDNDEAHRFPNSSLTSGQLALYLIVTVSNSGYADSLGAYNIQVNNRDAVPHDYFIHTRCGYFPTAADGIFR
jgi:hypothetical protein